MDGIEGHQRIGVGRRAGRCSALVTDAQLSLDGIERHVVGARHGREAGSPLSALKCRANLLDRDLTAVGIAVVGVTDRRTGEAILFAVQDFPSPLRI